MRVFSKKKLEFTHPETNERAGIDIAEFGNLPDWVERDPLFTWAKAEGSLETLGEDKPKAQTKRGEKAPKEPESTKEPEATEPPVGKAQ